MQIGSFAQYLNTRKLKLTPERKIILQEMLNSRGHVEAEDLLFNLKKKAKRTSRATVYRTLELLVDSGIVRKVDLGHGHSHYELVANHPHHEHMICLKCGRVIEFSDKAMEGALRKLCSKRGFEQTLHLFQVFGYCEKCKKLKR
jgi:Fur family ferric uptake transcriptional regulator